MKTHTEQIGDNFYLEFEIENPKLISTNDQYIHPVRKTKSGRYMSYFVKSPYLKEVQQFYQEVLQDKISVEDIQKLGEDLEDKNNGISLDIFLGMPLSDIREHDASNFIKALEDCITSRTKIDDSRNYEVSIHKQLYESETNNWIIKIRISKNPLQVYLKLS